MEKKNKKEGFIKVIVDDNDEPQSDLEKMYSDFNSSESEHSNDDFQEDNYENPDDKNKTKEEPETEKTKTEEKKDERSEEEKQLAYELQKVMFIKIMNYAVSGIHVFIFNIISKTKVEFDEMLMSEDELKKVDMYVTKEMVAILDIIPPWIFGLAQLELIFINKWKRIVKEKETEEKIKKEEENKNKAKTEIIDLTERIKK